MLSEYSGPDDNDLIANYVYLNGERVALFKDSSTDVRYYLNDHLGSVVAAVKYNGTLRNWMQYYPYGSLHNRTVSDAGGSLTFHFTGQEIEEELDIDWYYYGARYYDPALRIFTSVDPMQGKYPALSPYLYCKDNPIKYIDPDGNAVLPINITPEELKSNLPNWMPNIVKDFYVSTFFDPTITPPGLGMAKGPVKSLANTLLKAAGKKASNIISPATKELFKKMQLVRYLGKQGESSLNLVKNKTRIKSLTGTAKYRIPDEIDDYAKILTEVKNIKGKISFTKQLKDYHLWSKKEGYKFRLIVNPKSSLTKPLQLMVDESKILLETLK